MPLNIGYMELGGGDVFARIYYDKTWLEVDPTRNSDDAPLVDGPRGFCLDLTNASGRRSTVTVRGLNGTTTEITVGTGDPVTSGPASGRSRTAAQMAALGYTTRGNIGSIEIGS